MEQCKWNPPTGGKKGMHITAAGKLVKRSELGSVSDGTPMLKLNCEEPNRRQRAAVEKRMAELRAEGSLEAILNGRAPLPKDLRDAGWVLMHRNEASDKHDDRIAVLAGMNTAFKGTEFEKDVIEFSKILTPDKLRHYFHDMTSPALIEQFSCAALELLSSAPDELPEKFSTALWAELGSQPWSSPSEETKILDKAAVIAAGLLSKGLDPRLAVGAALLASRSSAARSTAEVLAALAAQGVFFCSDQEAAYAAMLDAVNITKSFKYDNISGLSVQLALDLCGPIEVSKNGLGPNVLREAAAAEAAASWPFTERIMAITMKEVLPPIVQAVNGGPEERTAAAAALLTGFAANPKGLVLEPGAVTAIASQIRGTTLADGTYITDKSAASIRVAASLAANAPDLMRPYIAMAGTSDEEILHRIDALNLVAAERDRAKEAIAAGDIKAALLAAPGLDWECIDGNSIRTHMENLGGAATTVLGTTSHRQRLDVVSNYPDVLSDRAAQQLGQLTGTSDFEALHRAMEVAYAVKDDPDAAYDFARSVIVTAGKLAELAPGSRAHLVHVDDEDAAIKLVGAVAELDTGTATSPFTHALAGVLRQGSTTSVVSVENITDAMRRFDNGYFSLEEPHEDGSLTAAVALSGFSQFGRLTAHTPTLDPDSDVNSILAAATDTLRQERSFRAAHGFSKSAGPVDSTEAFAAVEQRPYLAAVSNVVASYKPHLDAFDASDIYVPDEWSSSGGASWSEEQRTIRQLVERVEAQIGSVVVSDMELAPGDEAAADLAAVVLRDLKRSGGEAKGVHYEAAVALAAPGFSGLSLAEAAKVSQGARDAYAALAYAALEEATADSYSKSHFIRGAAARLGIEEPSPRLSVISGNTRVALELRNATSARVYMEAGLEDDVSAMLRRDVPDLKITPIDGGFSVSLPAGKSSTREAFVEAMDHVERTFSR